MKLSKKIVVSIFIVAFLGFPLMFAATSSAQEMETVQAIMSDGAEALFTSIDAEGRPIVAYGQVGFTSDVIDPEDPMFDGCLAMALVSIRGETLDYLLTNLAPTLFSGGDGGGTNSTKVPIPGYSQLQFDGGPDIEGIFNQLGDTFSLLITAYLDVSEANANTRMSQVLTTLSSTPFNFAFSELFTIRVDQALIDEYTGGESEVQLPFDSLDLFIYKLETPASQTIESILGAMNNDGLLGSIDNTDFTGATGSAAALVVIPHLELISGMIGGIGSMNSDDMSPYNQFMISQNFTMSGSIAIAGAGYIGEQALQDGDTELKLGTVVGANSFEPYPDKNSIIICMLPETANITGISPNTAGSFWEPNSTLILWNATQLGTQSDYIVYFQSDSFPPKITVDRTFDPTSLTEAGTVDVTVTVTNDGDFPITNVTIDETPLISRYPNLVITGPLSRNIAVIPNGESRVMEYSVTFPNEGAYGFIGGTVTYTYEGRQYSKDIPNESFVIPGSFIGDIMSLITDGWPYSGMALGIIALGAVVNIARRGGGAGSGKVYQV